MKVSFPNIAALIMVTIALLFRPDHSAAQSSPAKTATTWQDLGFNLPEGFPTDEIPLFDGLNKARGTWSFDGETAAGEDGTPLKGSLQVMGNPSIGMLPIWRLAWGWPADDPGHSVIHIIGAGPRKDGFDLMLTRIGPVKNPGVDEAKPRVLPTIFKGTWNLENRTLTWTEQGPPPGLPGKAAEEDPSKPKQSFDMVVAADGKISIRNSKHMPQDQMVTATTIVRTGEAPKETSTLVGKHSFGTVAEIDDRRIKLWLPPQATEISLFSERGGHLARYKIAETDFMAFLNKLWEAGKDSSAHERDSMAGEGEEASREGMVRRFKALGWKPLDNAVKYYSPSKSSGAMTTYYYDREAGIAYHDRGYW
jgi:hypothetical protein